MSEDDDDESRCPFCKEADGCKHLVAVFIRGDSAIGGGIFYDREGEQMTVIQRFDIPSKPTRIEMFRAFRGYLEKSTRKKLSTGWYADSPEEKPGLYGDQPEVLAALKKKNDEDRPNS